MADSRGLGRRLFVPVPFAVGEVPDRHNFGRELQLQRAAFELGVSSEPTRSVSERMNARRQLVLAAVGAAGVTILFFFILLSPKLHSIREVSDDLDAARQEEQSLQAQLMHLQQVKRNATQTME